MIKKRFFALLLCVFLAVSLLASTVCAIAPLDPDAECSARIVFTPEQLHAAGVEFRLYRVASVSADGRFRLLSRFANKGIDALLDNPTAGDYSLMASTLTAAIAADQSLTPSKTASTDSDGIAEFSEMATGLYLVMGDAYIEKGSIYFPQSYMLLLPGRDADENWIYHVTSNVKWEKRADAPYTLQVLKVWSDSGTDNHSDDEVTVELYRDGSLYDTQKLSKANNWLYQWTELESKADWQVKEKSFSGYTASITRKDNCVVITNTKNGTDSSGGTDSGSGKIPQSGQLWWPVPLLFCAGGVSLRRGLAAKKRKNHEE